MSFIIIIITFCDPWYTFLDVRTALLDPPSPFHFIPDLHSFQLYFISWQHFGFTLSSHVFGLSTNYKLTVILHLHFFVPEIYIRFHCIPLISLSLQRFGLTLSSLCVWSLYKTQSEHLSAMFRAGVLPGCLAHWSYCSQLAQGSLLKWLCCISGD